MGSNTKTNKRKKWPFVLIVVVLLAVSAVLIVPRIWTRGFPDPANSMIARTEVTTGDISTTVVGSGNLAQKIEEAKLPYGVTVKTVLAESGDAAQKGDVLAEVSLPSVANCVAEVKDALAGIETDMKNLIANNTETVSVKSKTAARVKKIYAADGQAAADVVAANGALLLLSLDGKMAVAFSSETVLAAGSAVTVTLSDGTEKESSVLTASAGTYVATLSDDGTILGDQVTVKSGEEAVGSGTLYIHDPLRVTADYGQITSVSVAENESVSAGATLLTLTKPVNDRSYATLIAKRNSLLNLLEQLTSLAITGELRAPASGTVDKVTAAEGSALSKAPSENAETTQAETAADYDNAGTAFTIITTDTVTLNVSVDELDIAAVKPGQEASVEIDALEGETFTGKVIGVSDAAEVNGNVSSYSAIIELEKTEGMKLGMSATATIIKEKRTDVLVIPLAAVQEFGEEVFVYTSLDDENNFGGQTPVTTGLSDGTTVEITEGLAEGDIVYYAQSFEDGSRDGIMMFSAGNAPDDYGRRVSRGDDDGGETPPDRPFPTDAAPSRSEVSEDD